jgi:hypothetical protein
MHGGRRPLTPSAIWIVHAAFCVSPILYAVIAYGVLRPAAEQAPALTGAGQTLYYAFEIVLYLACGVVAFLPQRILSPGEDRPVEGDATVRRQTALNRLTMRMVVCDAIFESLGILGLFNIFLDRPVWMPGLLMLVSFILMVGLTPALRARLGEFEQENR